MTSPYAAPEAASDARPLVIKWMRVYAGTMAAMYLAGACALGISGASVGVVAVSSALAIVHAVAMRAPFRPWGHTLAFVVLGFGIASIGFPFAALLALKWGRPEVKAAFGRLP